MPTAKEPDLRKVRRKLQEAMDTLPSSGGWDWHPAWQVAREVRKTLAGTLVLLRDYLGES